MNKEKAKNEDLRRCRVRDSKAPSKHFRPEYRLDQCELKCTLSFSLMKGN